MPNEKGEIFPGERGYALLLEELDDLPELVSRGLRVVTICHHGIGRSFEFAEMFTGLGFGSLFIEDGFEGISELSLDEQKVIALKLSVVPHIFASLNPEETRDFRDQIRLIDSQRREAVFVHDSTQSALPRLMKALIGEGKVS